MAKKGFGRTNATAAVLRLEQTLWQAADEPATQTAGNLQKNISPAAGR